MRVQYSTLLLRLVKRKGQGIAREQGGLGLILNSLSGVAALTVLCLLARNPWLWQQKDKGAADTTEEIGEKKDRNWRLLLRIGQACLRLVDWFAEASISGAHVLEGVVVRA